jgi:glycosyltransferase involved in cell wall biosynthesis
MDFTPRESLYSSSLGVGLSIVFCSNAYPPRFIGGAELIAHHQARILRESGHRVAVFAGDGSRGGGGYELTQDRYDGLDVYRVRLGVEDYDSRLVNFVNSGVEERFQAVLAERRPDVVHFHNLIGLSAGLIRMARAAGAATVLTVHDHWGFCYRNTLIRDDGNICDDFRECAKCQPFVQDRSGARIPIRLRNDFLAHQFDLLDFLISPSTYLAAAYIRAGVAESKVRVVWYGFDVPRFRDLQRTPMETRTRFTFLGYLGHHKGVATFLDAAARVRDTSRIRLNIVGEGDLGEKLREKTKAYGLESAVRFWGKVDNSDVETVLRETDVLVLPSIWPENQPISIIEAMCSGIPVVASRMGGIPEMVEDGKSGHLFTAGDPDDLASKLQWFLDHADAIPTMGERGRALIGERTLTNQVAQLERYYREALTRRR